MKGRGQGGGERGEGGEGTSLIYSSHFSVSLTADELLSMVFQEAPYSIPRDW